MTHTKMSFQSLINKMSHHFRGEPEGQTQAVGIAEMNLLIDTILVYILRLIKLNV